MIFKDKIKLKKNIFYRIIIINKSKRNNILIIFFIFFHKIVNIKLHIIINIKLFSISCAACAYALVHL